MKRSQVNAALAEAQALLKEFRWTLPAWAYWSNAEYKANPDLAVHLNRHQMGWDVTDFGLGDFDRRGLTLFCARNGVGHDENSIPYAEKLLFIKENQETPFHRHLKKMEDIINRGGGNLIVEFCHQHVEDREPITISVDGLRQTVAPREPVRLAPGQSVTMARSLYHRFYAEAGCGTVLAGEVSQINDDNGDNYFLQDIGRFSSIEEDVPPMHPLWNEVGGS